MHVDGLWTVSFSTARGEGAGVLTIGNGKLSGGDSNYFYSGSYEESGGRITGSLRVQHYFGGLTNVFGPIRDVQLQFTAAAGQDLIMGEAIPVGVPWDRLAVRMQRVIRFEDKP
jgi:hypothetical protein